MRGDCGAVFKYDDYFAGWRYFDAVGVISMRWHRAWKVAGSKSPTLSSVVRVRR